PAAHVRAGFRPHQPPPRSARPPARHGGRVALAQGAGRGVGARTRRSGRVERTAAAPVERESRELARSDRVRASARRASAAAADGGAVAARRAGAPRAPVAHGVAPVAGDLGEGAYEPATNWSPTLTPRRPASPAGISNTAFAPRLPAARQGRKSSAIFTTRSSRSRKTASIGKRMNAMCTDDAGFNRIPSPLGRPR